MRTSIENDRIHALACELLKRRGIEPTQATFDQYSDAAVVAAEAVERDGVGVDVPRMLGAAAVPKAGTPNETTLRALAKMATQGKLVSDGTLTADELVVAVEAERAAERLTADRSTPVGTITAEDHPGGVEYVHGSPYCGACGYSLGSGLCHC